MAQVNARDEGGPSITSSTIFPVTLPSPREKMVSADWFFPVLLFLNARAHSRRPWFVLIRLSCAYSRPYGTYVGP